MVGPRLWGALVAGALLTVLSVPAAAQLALVDTTVDVEITPVEVEFTRNQTETTTVSVTYTYGPGAAVFEDPVVKLRVVEAPGWLEVTIQPRNVILDVTAGNLHTRTTTAWATLRLTATVNAEYDVAGMVEVSAEVPETGNLAAATDSATLEVAMASAPAGGGSDGTGTGDDGDGTVDGPGDGTGDAGSADGSTDGSDATDPGSGTAADGTSSTNIVPSVAFAAMMAVFAIGVLGFWFWSRRV